MLAAARAATAQSVADAQAIARRIGQALAVHPRSEQAHRRSHRGPWTTAPWRGGPGDVDVEATVEQGLQVGRVGARVMVRERLGHRRAVVLVVDVSGSSRGSRLVSAAAAVGGLVDGLTEDDVAVIAFWSDAATLVELGQSITADEIVERLARLPARGLTNVAFPLGLAARQLAGATGVDERRVVLLSDCVHNAGPDPRPLASRLPRLDVLVDTTGECDRELGAQLASEGRGRVFPVAHPGDIAAALTAAFAG